MIVYVALGGFVIVADRAFAGYRKLRDRRRFDARRAAASSPLTSTPNFRQPSL